MVKKIKFPLEMASGVQVRSLEELKENFDLEKIIAYYMNGKLLIWLKDRYYDDKAAQILELNNKDKNLKQKICNIIGVEYKTSNVDLLEKNILLKGVRENEKRQDIIQNTCVKENESKIKDVIAAYKTSALFESTMINNNSDKSSNIFNVINSKLSELNYDIDKKAKNRADIIKHANLRGIFDNYLNKIS